MNSWKSKLIFIISIVFICLISFDFAFSAFNPMINYQGKLTDSTNTAVTDGDYNLRIKLCADSSCSSVLWTETRTDADKVQITNGLFSILLGEVSTSSLSSVDFNQDIYLQLEVGGTGVPAFETLLPRKRFASVPAAFEAAKLGGLASSSYAKIATNETISGAWSFNNILSITSNSASPALNILQSGAGTGVSIGNGVVTTTIFGGATSTFPYGATFATTGGRVAIGTSTAGYMLDVKGAINTQSTPGIAPYNNITNANFVAVNDYNDYPSANFLIGQTTADVNVNLVVGPLYTSAGTNKTASIIVSTNKSGVEATSYQTYLRQSTTLAEIITLNRSATVGAGVGTPFAISIGTGTSYAEKLRVTSVGLGIGVTSPSAYLNLKAGTATASTAPLKFSSGTNLSVTETGVVEYNGTQLFFTPASTRNILSQISGSTALTSGYIPFATTSGYLTQDTTAGGQFYWDASNHRLGIGTSSPNYSLTVVGDINTTGTIRINGADYGQYFIGSSGTAGSVWQSGGSGVGHWATTSSLGISGGSMPSGSLGQTIAYGGSGWEATSTLYVSGSSLFNATSTFSGNIINSNGIFISGVSSGISGSTELLSNTGFESSVSSISPWAVVATSGSATYAVSTTTPTPVSGSNWLALYSGALSNYVAIQQSGLSNPGSTAMTLSFYGLGQVAGEKLRISIMGDSCGGGGNKWTYNFTMFTWDCTNYIGASYSFYAKDFTLTAVYSQYSVNFTSLSTASSTSGLSLMMMAGSSDAGTYHGQNMVVDDFSLGYDASTQNTAFTLNAQNFSSTNTTDNILSVRSNGTEKLGLTSGGNLSLTGNMDVDGTYKINGVDLGQFFINSTGTLGQLWQSDGTSAGSWVNTSSLGILPSGTSGQIMTYSGTSWIASSSAQLTSLSVNGTLGVGTGAPSTIQFEVMSSALNQLKLSYNSSNYAIFGVDSNGNLDITPTSTGSTFTEGFNGSWPPSGWTSGGSAMWQQNLITTYEGAGAAQSGTIAGDQTSWFDIDMETVGGNITFWWKVSSESNWDKLAFCYDMDGGCTKDTGSISSISGEVGWVQITHPITAGTHSFRWLYGKDSSASSGADAGYIDNISIPTPAGQVSVTVNSNGAFSGALLVGTTTPFASSSNYMLQVDSGSSTGDGIAVNGHIIASSYITGTTTVDLAESYPVLADCKLNNSCPEAGDTVCSTFVSTTYYIEKCTEKASKKTLGVITTNPGFILGGKFSDLLEGDSTQMFRAVALVGRVPVKVVMTSGTIEVGDEITVADLPGFATKAIEPGRVIGTALTSFDPQVFGATTGTLEIFVNPHWSIGQIEEKDIPTELPDFSSSTTPSILDQFTLAVENSLQKLGLVIKNGVAKLKELIVDKLFVKQLCVGETCIGEQQLKDLLEKNQVLQLQTNSQNLLNTIASSPPAVTLSDSTSTFSAFSSSSEVINNDLAPDLSTPTIADIAVPTLNSTAETIVPLAPIVENVLPPILTTDIIVVPQADPITTEAAN